jgi:hypothetical protein
VRWKGRQRVFGRLREALWRDCALQEEKKEKQQRAQRGGWNEAEWISADLEDEDREYGGCVEERKDGKT